MSDIETDTEWSHLLGRGMAGKLQGKEFDSVVSDMVTWSEWQKNHPQTTVLDMSDTSGNYQREFYQDPKRFVFGFMVQGKPYSLSFPELLNKPVHTFEVQGERLVATLDKQGMVIRLFQATIDEKVLDFKQIDAHTMEDSSTMSRWSFTGKVISGDLTGHQLEQRVGIMSFRRPWENFHPDSSKINIESDSEQ